MTELDRILQVGCRGRRAVGMVAATCVASGRGPAWRPSSPACTRAADGGRLPVGPSLCPGVVGATAAPAVFRERVGAARSRSGEMDRARSATRRSCALGRQAVVGTTCAGPPGMVQLLGQADRDGGEDCRRHTYWRESRPAPRQVGRTTHRTELEEHLGMRRPRPDASRLPCPHAGAGPQTYP